MSLDNAIRHFPEDDEGRFRYLLEEIKELKDIIREQKTTASENTISIPSPNAIRLDESRTEPANPEKDEPGEHEIAELKREVNSMQEAIDQTKHELASLHVNGFDGEKMTRAQSELDEVIKASEVATESILAAAEIIDERAANLNAHLTGAETDAASDITERVVEIFEACNFQDLSGQRITKVVSTLKFIEERLDHIMDIWGGSSYFDSVDVAPSEVKEHDALLNGPALQEDDDVIGQDDIDALFN